MAAVRFVKMPDALASLGSDVVLWLNRVANRRTAAQADSTASDVATLKADFNALLAKMRAAGMMDQ
jgi:hypothetical protein